MPAAETLTMNNATSVAVVNDGRTVLIGRQPEPMAAPMSFLRFWLNAR